MKKLFQGKRVTIMGLGLHGGGVGVAKFFCKNGAEVLVTDTKAEEQLIESIQKLKNFKIKYILGRHRPEDFVATDLIIKNPAVPRKSPFLAIAERNKIPIKTDIEIFFDLCKAPIIGVTGTKGKSTTATLIYNFLKTKYKNTVLAGNIGFSPLELLDRINPKTKVVLELSSFELENLKKSPQTAVVTTILPDHLDRYKNLNEYIEAKKTIFKYQNKEDILILNYDNLATRNFSLLAPSNVYFYSISPPLSQKTACLIKNGKVFFNNEKEPICDTNDIKLTGEHNLSNALAAISVVKILKISSQNIKKILSKFEGVSSRQELIRELKGVKYFNDTTATMPDAAIVAIKTLKGKFPDSNLILIAGGQDKNLKYKELAKEIEKNTEHLVLLPGTASDKIKKELELFKDKINIYPVNSIAEAVKKAYKIAREGDIVLLSPAAASFNLFKNEFDRGEQFNKAVKTLI